MSRAFSSGSVGFVLVCANLLPVTSHFMTPSTTHIGFTATNYPGICPEICFFGHISPCKSQDWHISGQDLQIVTYPWTRSPDCQILEIDLQIFLQIFRVGLQIDKSLDLIPQITLLYVASLRIGCLDQISGTGVRIESKIAGELSYWTMISCGHNNKVRVFPATCLLLSPGGYRGQKYLGQQTTTAAG